MKRYVRCRAKKWLRVGTVKAYAINWFVSPSFPSPTLHEVTTAPATAEAHRSPAGSGVLLQNMVVYPPSKYGR